MKLALCRSPYTKVYNFYSEEGIVKRDTYVPYPLLLLAGHIKKVYKNEVDIRIFDGEIGLKSQDELIDDIAYWNPDLIGFTVTTPEIDVTLNICKALKNEMPDCKTILGGPHITGVRPSGSYPHIDYMVIGEGEYSLEKIIRTEKNGCQNESETAYLQSRDVDLDETGDPDYSIINTDDYQFIDPLNGFVKAHTIFSVRGCPHKCKFCFANRNYRRRNLDKVIEEIKYLYSKGVRLIDINDETLTQNRKRFFELTDKILALDYNDLRFIGLTRGDMITEEIAERLAQANFRRMYVGVESGSDRILKIVGKNTTAEKVKKGISLLGKQDIIVRGSFILGLPYETHETVNQTIEFAKDLDMQIAGFNIATPYPGTELYDMALNKQGIEFTVDMESDNSYSQFRRWGNCVIRTPELTSKDLINYQKKANDEFFSQQKIIDFYRRTFEQGNKERYWHRTLNHVYERVYGKNLDYWDNLN